MKKQPKRATPKPVEAWAVVEAGTAICSLDSRTRPLAIFLGMMNAVETAKWNSRRSLDVIRVRIVPIVIRKPRTKRKERKK